MNIYTHGDFDGIVSAALLSRFLKTGRIFFTSPRSIFEQQVTEQDAVCDLPYPHRSIGLWFDHHEANIETVNKMGLADQIKGKFVPAPSAAQVVLDYFQTEHQIPDFITETVNQANIIDSMAYDSVEQWLEPTPAHRINRALFVPSEKFHEARRYMILLVKTVAKFPLEDIAESEDVDERYQLAKKHEDDSVDLIRKVAQRLGAGGEIILLDFTEDRFRPSFSKNMAYTIFPDADAILQLNPGFERGKRVNSIGISFSVNPFDKQANQYDVAAILGDLGLGSGHAGAAGGSFSADSKQKLLANKQQLLENIVDLFAKQSQSQI